MKTSFSAIWLDRVGMFCIIWSREAVAWKPLCCVGCAASQAPLHVREQQVVGVYLHALCRTDPWSACLQHMVQVRLLSVPAGPGRCPCLSLESSHFFCLEYYCLFHFI